MHGAPIAPNKPAPQPQKIIEEPARTARSAATVVVALPRTSPKVIICHKTNRSTLGCGEKGRLGLAALLS